MANHNANKCRKELQKMMKEPANKHCADCGGYPATWASTNLGVFICLRCSGIHRGLGVHISFVKSASLDDWNMKLFNFFHEKGGNESINAIFEASLPKSSKIHEGSEQIDVAKFIRLKYIKKIWYSSKAKKKIDKKHNLQKQKERSRMKQISENDKFVGKKENLRKYHQRKESNEHSNNNNINNIKFSLSKRDSFLSLDQMDTFNQQSHTIEQKKDQKNDNQNILDMFSNNYSNNNNNATSNVSPHADDGVKMNILSKYHVQQPQQQMMNNGYVYGANVAMASNAVTYQNNNNAPADWASTNNNNSKKKVNQQWVGFNGDMDNSNNNNNGKNNQGDSKNYILSKYQHQQASNMGGMNQYGYNNNNMNNFGMMNQNNYQMPVASNW